MERRFRKAPFALAGEAKDAPDLRERFGAFAVAVRAGPPELRPCPDEAPGALLAPGIRSPLAAGLRRRCREARPGLVGLASRPA